MKVAYLTNQYPSVTHTFIRREIAALEKKGIEVERFSIRPPPMQLVDPDDIAEAARTTVILERNLVTLLLTATMTALRHPVRFTRALGKSIQMGLRSERGLLRNLAYLVSACTALRLLEQAQCTHVHAHFGTNSTAVVLLCISRPGPATVDVARKTRKPPGFALGLARRQAQSRNAWIFSCAGCAMLLLSRWRRRAAVEYLRFCIRR